MAPSGDIAAAYLRLERLHPELQVLGLLAAAKQAHARRPPQSAAGAPPANGAAGRQRPRGVHQRALSVGSRERVRGEAHNSAPRAPLALAWLQTCRTHMHCARICRHKLGVACAEKGPAEAAHPPLCCAAGRQAGRQAGRRAGRQAVEEQRHPRAQRWRRAELHVAWACARARWSALHSRHARRAGTGAELCLCPAGAPGCSLCFMAHAVPRRRRARGRVGARAAQTQEAAPLCRGTAWATRVQPPPPPLPRAAPTRAPRRTQRQRGAA